MGGGQDWAQECYEDQQRDERIDEAIAEHREELRSAEHQIQRAAEIAEIAVCVLCLVLVWLLAILFG